VIKKSIIQQQYSQCSPQYSQFSFFERGRPQEGGRYVICKYDPDARISSERGAVDVSPKESNVRTRVHEYGGGAVTFGGKGSKEIYYSEFATQRLMKLVQDSPDGSEPTPVTVRKFVRQR